MLHFYEPRVARSHSTGTRPISIILAWIGPHDAPFQLNLTPPNWIEFGIQASKASGLVPAQVYISPAYTPPARRIALLHPIKHPKTLVICLFIGTAHSLTQDVADLRTAAALRIRVIVPQSHHSRQQRRVGASEGRRQPRHFVPQRFFKRVRVRASCFPFEAASPSAQVHNRRPHCCAIQQR